MYSQLAPRARRRRRRWKKVWGGHTTGPGAGSARGLQHQKPGKFGSFFFQNELFFFKVGTGGDVPRPAGFFIILGGANDKELFFCFVFFVPGINGQKGKK